MREKISVMERGCLSMSLSSFQNLEVQKSAHDLHVAPQQSALAVAVAINKDYPRHSPLTVRQQQWRPSMAAIAVIVDRSNS